MRRYLAGKYSTRQSFTREYLKLELLISAKEARELQFEVLGTVKDMPFEGFVKCVEVALERVKGTY